VNHHQNISFDGLWIDMNEPANFGTNENRIWNWPEKDKPYWSLKCPHSKFDDPRSGQSLLLSPNQCPAYFPLDGKVDLLMTIPLLFCPVA
jgi:hypothetical protein